MNSAVIFLNHTWPGFSERTLLKDLRRLVRRSLTIFGARFLAAVLRVTTGGEEGRESPHRQYRTILKCNSALKSVTLKCQK